MRRLIQNRSPFKWQTWINPLMMLVCLYLFFRLGFSETPLFDRHHQEGFAQGEVPIVQYTPSARLMALIGVLIVFNIFFFQSLRQWARYFLNRKLILSYLFFAIIPLITIILISAAGIRAWFGISNTLNIEYAMNQYSLELENFVQSIHIGLKNAGLPPSYNEFEKRVKRVIEMSQSSEMTLQKHLPDGIIPVEVYWLPKKIPGQSRTLFPMHFTHKDIVKEARWIQEDTEAYEAIYPSWLQGNRWTDIVTHDGELHLRHFSATDYEDHAIVILATIPIDKYFLNQMIAFQAVRITLTNREGTRFVSTDSPTGKWLFKLLLKPLSSKWDLTALDWHSGYYQDFGQMIFELDPTQLGRTLSQTGRIHIFHGDQKRSYFRFIIGVALLLVFGQLVAAVFGIYLVRYITRSLNLIAYGHEKITGGELNYRLPFIGKDQLGAMGRSFNSMVSSIESLMSQVLEKEKYQEELRIARDIQKSLLPNLAVLPWCSNVAATCIPAREVGGDYYEVLPVGERQNGIFIADVSGKGTSAAFYMAELKGVLLALKHLWEDPCRLMMRMNEILQPALQSHIFISAAYLLLDAQHGKGALARAGHCPSFHVKSDGAVTDLMPPGMAIGIAPNHVFGKIIRALEFEMSPCDKIVMYTDGLDEMTFRHQFYGRKRLKAILEKHPGQSVADLKETILGDVLQFQSSEEQNDDLTLVVAGLPFIERIP